MENVIHINGFQFQNYHVGRKRLLKSLENVQVSEAERVPFTLRQLGDFFRLARLRVGLSIGEAASLFSLSKSELETFERGGGQVPAPLLTSFCVRYGVERDFEEFYSYLRGAVNPAEGAAFQRARPVLEKLGWIRPKDW